MSRQGASAPATSGGLSALNLRLTRGDTLVIDDVSCLLEPGTFTAIIGPNGAGKSSLLQIVTGILPAGAAASVTVGDTDLLGIGRRERARLLALAEQHADGDSPLRVWNVVMLGRTPHLGAWSPEGPEDHRIVADALARVDMTAFRDRQFETLSGGERQRVHLARALAQQPRLLLLDEPTNHLDIRAQLSLLSLVREQTAAGLTAVAALHDLNAAVAYADQVIVLCGGRVRAAGDPAEVLTSELISEVYGVSADVLRHPRTGRPLIAFDTV